MEPGKHESDMSRREKRELEKSYLDQMNVLQKIQHIAAYYKTHMLITFITFLGIIFAIYYIYRMQVDIVFNALVINSYGGNVKTLGNDFKEFIQDQNRFHEIYIDDSLLFSGSSLSDYYKEMKLASYINNKLVDVMILDEEFYSHYKDSGLLQPLFKIVSDEQLEDLNPDREDVFGIRITGNKKLKEHGFQIQGNVYLVVMQNAPCPENAKRFIEFLCE